MFNHVMKYIVFAAFISVPLQASAEVILIDDVTVQVEPLQGNNFQIFFKFDLPKVPATANIDYAELSFGVNIKEASSGMKFEVLSREKDATDKLIDYNTNPVTARISKGTIGLAEVRLDITQLAELWSKEGEKNNGIILVAHRRITEKALSNEKISLAPLFKKATVRIFYTEIE